MKEIRRQEFKEEVIATVVGLIAVFAFIWGLGILTTLL